MVIHLEYSALAKGMERGRIMEASLAVGTASMAYSYYRLIDLEMQCQSSVQTHFRSESHGMQLKSLIH